MDFLKQPHAMQMQAIVRESSGFFIDVGDTVGESSPHYFVPLFVMDDLNQPATKADIRRVEVRMERHDDRLDSFEKRLDSIDRRLESFEKKRRFFEEKMLASNEKLWEDIDRVLVLLGNIEKKLSIPILDHERRITVLEEKFGLVS